MPYANECPHTFCSIVQQYDSRAQTIVYILLCILYNIYLYCEINKTAVIVSRQKLVSPSQFPLADSKV